MKELTINERVFFLVGFEGTFVLEVEVTLSEILIAEANKAECEYIYALQEQGDDILNLEVDETMYVRTNRDHAGSKGVLIRRT